MGPARLCATVSLGGDKDIPEAGTKNKLTVRRRAALPALGQHPVQRVYVEVGTLDVNAQRRLGLQDVLVVAGGLDDHSELEHAVADRRRLFRRGFQRLRVARCR